VREFLTKIIQRVTRMYVFLNEAMFSSFMRRVRIGHKLTYLWAIFETKLFNSVRRIENIAMHETSKKIWGGWGTMYNSK